ncbi:uncharacterized protein EI97DRAFT_435711, partial [Westerdykella ornata]
MPALPSSLMLPPASLSSDLSSWQAQSGFTAFASTPDLIYPHPSIPTPTSRSHIITTN